MNDKNNDNSSEDIQDFLSGNQESVLKSFAAQFVSAPSLSVLESSSDSFYEIIWETTIQEQDYYLVRRQPKLIQSIRLSPRELEIARLISQGLSNKCIGERLDISCWTVSTYVRRIFGKLGVTSRVSMVARLMELQLL
jgi:DNA-binding CsgD family transcriptional regulator